MVAGTAAATADACPAQSPEEIRASEAIREPLKARWEEKLQELRQEWQRQNSAPSAHTGTPGQVVQSVALPPNLKDEVTTMLDGMKSHLDAMYTGQGSVSAACANLWAPGEEKKAGGQTDNMKKVCKTLVQVVNWMGNLEKDGTKERSNSTQEKDWEKYLRCVIGYEVLLRILLPKYKVEEFMKIISEVMKKGGSEGKDKNGNAICPWVKLEDIGNEEGSIGSHVQDWLNKAKQDSGKGSIKDFKHIIAWSRPDKDEDKQKERAKRRARTCKSDSIMDLLQAGVSNPLEVLVDPLEKANDCIEKAQTDNSGKTNVLCNRLKCIDDYLKKLPPPPSPTTPSPGGPPGGSQPQTGQLSATNTFWENNGAVKALWDELAQAMIDNGTNEQTECKQLPNPSEKAACNYLHAGFKELYKDMSTPSPSGDDVLKNNPSFRQTMGCFLLHAYAKHMKEKATCLIDDGIKKAFENAGSCTSNSNGTCIPCKWQKEDNSWEDCLQNIPINGGTTGTGDNAKKRVEKIVQDDADGKIRDMLTKINTMSLCDRFQCISERWLKQNKSNGERLTSTDWDRVRSRVTSQITELATATSENMRKDTNLSKYCTMKDDKDGKEACLLIAAGLKNLYDIEDKGNNSVDASFQRTMRCVLLNAIAERLLELPCKDEKSVEAGIRKAFDESGNIMTASGNCKDDKCFKCERFKTYKSCTIKENSTVGSKEEKLHEEIDPKLKDSVLLSTSSLRTSSLTKTICKPCEETNLCERLGCIVKKWEGRNNKSPSGKVTWEKMKVDFEKVLEALLNDMKDRTKQDNADTYCNADKDGNTWSGSDAHGVANKTACKLVAAGLHHISNIQLEYNDTANPGKGEDKNPYDNQEFHQLVSCLMLNAVVQKMKEHSPICDIQPGITKAFGVVDKIKTDNCKNDKPCILCKWSDDDYNKLDSCPIGTGNATDKVKPTLEALLTGGKKNEVEAALMDITRTHGNASSSLCLRLQCLAPRVQASNNADDFWNKEVKDLWTELSTAMTETKGEGTNGGKCNTMGDDNRQGTHSEQTACNYLHAGLTKLYSNDGTSSTPSTTSSSGTITLKDNPLLRQTVGCFLLHSYAKQMKDEAKCLVESGIKKAFKLGDDLIKQGANCNGTNGTGQCVLCQWEEEKYDSCQITTTGTNGSTKEKVHQKLEKIQPKINETSTETLKKINEMKNLCDYIKCAAPKWFKNHSSVTGGTKKDWCEFWDKGVKPKLEDMFNNIAQNGKNNTNPVCKAFGDDNDDSVERKACNHIAAGLDYINRVQVTQNGITDDDKFFKRSMMCAALNLYADQIKQKSQDKCPIDEERIKKMFTNWNAFNRFSSLSSSSTSCKSGVYGCFKCQREEKFSEGCHLSVADALVDTKSQPNGNCNTKATEVKNKMDGLLDDSSTIKMKTTLNEINKMNHFCTQLQCAAKKWNLATKGKKETPSWNDIESVVNDELKKLLEEMSKKNDDSTFDQYCKDVSSSSPKDTKGEITAKQKACKLFASGLKHISDIKDKNPNNMDVVPLKQTMMCAALNLYADQLIEKSTKQCPLDKKKMEEAITYAFRKSSNIMGIGTASCPPGTNGSNSCFVCNREEKDFHNCQIGNNSNDKVGDKMTELLEQKKSETKMDETLDKINSKDIFCTELQCAIKQHYNKDKTKNGLSGGMATPNWDQIKDDAKGELSKLLQQMTEGQTKSDLSKYCNDNDAKWNTLRNKEKQTNKAACLLFAAGLKHIYTYGNGRGSGPVKGPSFEQTMGCLFLKEYAKQLKVLAENEKKHKVHPLCSVDKGIDRAFEQSKDIMKSVLPECDKGPNSISCFECKIDQDYGTCLIGTDNVKTKVEPMLKDNDRNQKHMEETLANTLCPILLTDILTPFLPLAPVSIGLSAMAYYLWKYFGPLGKGGARFRRSPADIPGPSVQEQLLDHVEEAGPHEYRLVKERKPRSVPARTKRSGPVNRRTIIEIHFEVLDECQKGDTQLNQKDFLELLVREFMGSELMEEEQVPKEEVLMENVPMQNVPMERVPSLGSGLLV
ncbi:SICAvar, type I [Plasmodium knowlesi strain H]|uniref:SICAvar, type I n=3 Tax=Plasmodium knowlesi TaxID=5850 RepID=A0A1A7VCU2_PLAKH|nr:SICAvar, type I [Plasmodium knowlesi strain H]OTN67596.1 SICAvar type I [Plasmodium knowlesi]CAA9990466.1 SICAvar, type I [Plasmodium knowlesi strain H]SBO19674.1 SICAvar, type I [Plasmodium knowlesi strain H]SBO22497.1 SICAvar, type I [Plasmodium knowlesi strain H]VVS79940.1 SICAvar, type I [Plasmodium knowlesi strain H]